MKFQKINGMEFSRWIAAKLLQNSNLKGVKYYDKEDEYTDIIEKCLREDAKEQSCFYEVQTGDCSTGDVEECSTFENKDDAYEEYYHLNGKGLSVRILKVDENGSPIEEIKSNYEEV